MAVDPQILARIELAVAELQRAIAALGADEMFASQLTFGGNVLAAAVADARVSGINARQVRDLEFALNDIAGFVGELTAAGAASVMPPITKLQNGLTELRSYVFIPQTVVSAAGALQLKLRERRTAIERQTFLPPGTPAPPLPHDPKMLVPEATSLRDAFHKAGFDTPLLDQFLDDPPSIRMKGISDLIDEIDTIVD